MVKIFWYGMALLMVNSMSKMAIDYKKGEWPKHKFLFTYAQATYDPKSWVFCWWLSKVGF